MNEKNILSLLKKFSNELPKFEDGSIDYSNSNEAPVITVFVKYQDKILLLKRSDKVRTYRRKWNTVAGYLDEVKPIKEKVLEELREETKISEKDILNIKYGDPYKLKDKKIKKTWIVHPVLVALKNKVEIKIDWEHTEYRWIKIEELKDYDFVASLDETLRRVLNEQTALRKRIWNFN